MGTNNTIIKEVKEVEFVHCEGGKAVHQHSWTPESNPVKMDAETWWPNAFRPTNASRVTTDFWVCEEEGFEGRLAMILHTAHKDTQDNKNTVKNNTL